MTTSDDETQIVPTIPSASGGAPPAAPGTPPPAAPATPPPAAPAGAAAVARAAPEEPAAPAPVMPPPAAPVAPRALTPAQSSSIRITELKRGPDLPIRALWFLLVGWWLTAIVSALAWAATVTIIGLPLGIWMINRIPTVLTLRPRTAYRYEYTDELGHRVDVVDDIEQPPWYIRGLWFVFVGWWASGLAMTIAWILCVLLITLPIGLMIYNRVPFVASLYRY